MTITITLSESAQESIESEVSEGGYASVSEYLMVLVRQEQKRKAREKMEEMLLETLNSESNECNAGGHLNEK